MSCRAHEQEAAEQQALDLGARGEDVAGQDHPRGEAADENEGRQAVVPLALARREPADGGREQERRAERAEWSREPQPIGEHEPGEGGGPDGVGEEGQPAQDDPGPDQTRPYGEDQHLDEAALGERQLERLEHGRHATTQTRLSLMLIASVVFAC